MKKINILKTTYVFKFIADGTFFQLLTLYLNTLNFSAVKITTILASTMVFEFITSLLTAKIADNQKISLFIIRTSLFLTAITAIFFTHTDNFYLILFLTSIYALGRGPLVFLLDGIAMSYENYYKIPFTKFRLFGSLGLIVSLVLSGIIAKNFGYTFLYYFSALMFVIAGILSCFLIEVPCLITTQNAGTIKGILKNKGFYIFLIYGIFYQSVVYSCDNLRMLYFETYGLPVDVITWITAAVVLIETISLFLYSRIYNKIGLKNVLLITVFLHFIQYIACGLLFPLSIIIPLTVLVGIANGFTLGATLNIINELIGYENLKKSILLFSLVASITNSIFNLSFGVIIDYLGIRYIMLISAFLILISLPVIVFKIKSNKQTEISVCNSK